jgi:hypothetical protein
MYYVSMKDAFLSGWGDADKRDAIFIFECADKVEAQTVKNYARRRGDQTQIVIHDSNPISQFDEQYNLVITKNKEECPKWYGKE